jgi:RNA polymerase sigma-70 factor (ECF subfamily)
MARDDQGFSDLFVRDYARVLKTIFVLLGDRNEAEDITQEAFARLLVHWQKVAGYDRPGAWVTRVAVRLAIDRRRVRRSRRRIHVMDTPEVSASDPDLYRAILELPSSQRASICLHYLEDRPINEVAQLLDCSPGTIKTHLYRARQKLARVLSEEEEPTDVTG